jgi:hypothetical protein
MSITADSDLRSNVQCLAREWRRVHGEPPTVEQLRPFLEPDELVAAVEMAEGGSPWLKNENLNP